MDSDTICQLVQVAYMLWDLIFTYKKKKKRFTYWFLCVFRISGELASHQWYNGLTSHLRLVLHKPWHGRDLVSWWGRPSNSGWFMCFANL